MDHYLELALLPDPEFSQPLLMNALLAKFHRALHDLRRDDIGISFPDVGQAPANLGARLRIHGCEEALASLQHTQWLRGMRDHLRCEGPSQVPSGAKYRCVSRVQVDSNPERLRRRLIKRHGVSEQEALQRIPQGRGKQCSLPYAQLRSRTSGETFRLFVKHGPLLDQPQLGRFGGYGLSSRSTIPWF